MEHFVKRVALALLLMAISGYFLALTQSTPDLAFPDYCRSGLMPGADFFEQAYQVLYTGYKESSETRFLISIKGIVDQTLLK